MKKTIYKLTKKNDDVYYTNNRHELVDVINKDNTEDDTFKPYNINTINGLLYNNNKQRRGVKALERFNGQEYFKEYLDDYANQLTEQKTYTHQTIRKFKQHFLSFLNEIEITSRNNGDDDAVIRQRINSVGLLKI
jgi:hypothetical protein|tara:strand:+ start:246 stop:650 length:405 start_codon:yes stop_codon:yes gene_type:complete